ncbi:hypothetical protein F5Y16DRAFT_400878 [Xylariaceae sp. FL0255]|nr:hypothetical protein F5Y16DRAFT_400878 [Xylariaceae sp. FL0255]
MAIINSLPGVEVIVYTEGRNAKEYNDSAGCHDVFPHPTKMASHFIACKDGETFKILARVTKEYDWSASDHRLSFSLFIDGIWQGDKFFHKENVSVEDMEEELTCSVRRHSHIPGRYMSTEIAFSSVNPVWAPTIQSHKDDVERLKRMGTIEVRVNRADNNKYTLAMVSAHDFPKSITVCRTALAMQSPNIQTHGTVFAHPQPLRTRRCLLQGDRIEEDSDPIAVFRFKYRSTDLIEDLIARGIASHCAHRGSDTNKSSGEELDKDHSDEDRTDDSGVNHDDEGSNNNDHFESESDDDDDDGSDDDSVGDAHVQKTCTGKYFLRSAGKIRQTFSTGPSIRQLRRRQTIVSDSSDEESVRDVIYVRPPLTHRSTTESSVNDNESDDEIRDHGDDNNVNGGREQREDVCQDPGPCRRETETTRSHRSDIEGNTVLNTKQPGNKILDSSNPAKSDTWAGRGEITDINYLRQEVKAQQEISDQIQKKFGHLQDKHNKRHKALEDLMNKKFGRLQERYGKRYRRLMDQQKSSNETSAYLWQQLDSYYQRLESQQPSKSVATQYFDIRSSRESPISRLSPKATQVVTSTPIGVKRKARDYMASREQEEPTALGYDSDGLGFLRSRAKRRRKTITDILGLMDQ